MSIKHVITRGFIGGGSSPYVVTRGYGSLDLNVPAGPSIPYPSLVRPHHVFVPGSDRNSVFVPGDDRRFVKPGELPK